MFRVQCKNCGDMAKVDRAHVHFWASIRCGYENVGEDCFPTRARVTAARKKARRVRFRRTT